MSTRSFLRAVAPISLVFAAACATSAAPAAAPAPEGAAAAATPEMVAQGRQLFASTGRCSVCHEAGGRGGSLGPDLTDNEWLWVDPTSDLHPQIVDIITHGIPEPKQFPTPMPAMGGANLSADQINALAAYVASL